MPTRAMREAAEAAFAAGLGLYRRCACRLTFEFTGAERLHRAAYVGMIGSASSATLALTLVYVPPNYEPERDQPEW